MEHSYPPITSKEDRKAPEGKYRVLLNDRSSESPQLYLVGDYDRPEEAILKAETLGARSQNGIVQTNTGFVLYPWFDGHQLHTRRELLENFGRGERPLTEASADKIEQKQHERIPGWRKGDRMVVFWQDIADATGAVARPGDF